MVLNTTMCVRYIVSGNLLYGGRQLSLVLYGDQMAGMRGGKEVPEGGDICMHIAGSLRCTVETNTIF